MATINSSIVIISLPAHLSAGHLVAVARILLREHSVLGRHLHGAADARVPDRRSDLRRDWQFALIPRLNGIGSGTFGTPNRDAIMNSVPASQRGSASGMAGPLQNAGMSLSIGIFFSLMIAGLSTNLPHGLKTGLSAHGVSQAVANQVAQTPPVGGLFAAFLGYTPIKNLLGPPANSGICRHQTRRPSPVRTSSRS